MSFEKLLVDSTGVSEDTSIMGFWDMLRCFFIFTGFTLNVPEPRYPCLFEPILYF